MNTPEFKMKTNASWIELLTKKLTLTLVFLKLMKKGIDSCFRNVQLALRFL